MRTEVTVLNKMAELYKKGMKGREVADALNRAGYKTAKGVSFTVGNLNALKLVNRGYLIRQGVTRFNNPQNRNRRVVKSTTKVTAPIGTTKLTTIAAILTDPSLSHTQIVRVLQAYVGVAL
jgi:hypothetical protein